MSGLPPECSVCGEKWPMDPRLKPPVCKFCREKARNDEAPVPEANALLPSLPCGAREAWLRAKFPAYNALKEQQAERWKSMGFWEAANTVCDAVFEGEQRACLQSVGYFELDSRKVHEEVLAFMNANKGSN